MKDIQDAAGVQEGDFGHSNPALWDLNADKEMMGTEQAKYMINVRQFAKFVVALGDKV